MSLPLQRAKRCWVPLLLLLGVLLISAELTTMVAAAADPEEECDNPSKVRLVTQEELAMYVSHYTFSSIIVCSH
jgi:hypothetical protein